MVDKKQKTLFSRSDDYVTGASLLAGLGALIGASCCVLPLLLINLGVSTALIANVAFFAFLKPYLIVLTIILIAVALISSRGRLRGLSKVKMFLIFIAVALVILALILPMYEAQLLRWIR